jgi:protein O-GlcNAc transferase
MHGGFRSKWLLKDVARNKLPDLPRGIGMRCEAQDAPCGQATPAVCNNAARPNPTGEIGELVSCHILKDGTLNGATAKVFGNACGRDGWCRQWQLVGPSSFSRCDTCGGFVAFSNRENSFCDDGHACRCKPPCQRQTEINQKQVKQMTKRGPSNIFQAPPRTASAPNAMAALIMQVQRAMALHQQGKLTEAAEIYSAVLRSTPNQVESLHYLGVVRHQLGRHDEAVALIQKAITLQKNDPSAHSNLGLALHAQGQYQAALESYDRALALDRKFVDALSNRAITLKCMGRLADAVGCYDQLIALRPLARLFNARGCLQAAMHCYDDALESFDQAVKLQPDLFDAWSNKGGTHYLVGQHQQAVDAFAQGSQLVPGSAGFRLKRLIARIPIILEAQDDVAAIRVNFARDIATFSQWLDHHPVPNPLEVVGSCQPFYLAYHAQNNRELLAPYGQICTRLMAQWASVNGVAPLPARSIGTTRIRIGVVSAHVSDHPVWTAIVRGWFQELDATRFELHVFHLSMHEDAQTALARARATVFHSGTKSTLEWAKLIVASEVDVLLYPELGMDQLTPQLAAMRLAHRQAATWGHPETTGLPTIDLYLSAEGFEEPLAQAQACYTERLVSLPHLGCYYEPDAVPVENVNLADLGLKAGAPLLVCPGSPYKYAPEHDHVLVDIAKRVPSAQFLFFTVPGPQNLSQLLQQRLSERFKAQGLDPARHLVVTPWQTRPQFYSILRQADVFLDTIGFSGFNTAMQAVDCALPIVTMEGAFMRGRFASAILKRMGLDELAHGSAQTYVESAVRLASDPAHAGLMREKMVAQRGVLYRDPAPVRALENVLHAWCEGA